jgi:phytoene/squalene synthetase
MDAFVVDHPSAKSTALPHCDEIRREAADRLRRSGNLALRDVSCDARDDVIYLPGRLPFYDLKQIARAVAVKGVRRVVNRIVSRVFATGTVLQVFGLAWRIPAANRGQSGAGEVT